MPPKRKEQKLSPKEVAEFFSREASQEPGGTTPHRKRKKKLKPKLVTIHQIFERAQALTEQGNWKEACQSLFEPLRNLSDQMSIAILQRDAGLYKTISKAIGESSRLFLTKQYEAAYENLEIAYGLLSSFEEALQTEAAMSEPLAVSDTSELGEEVPSVDEAPIVEEEPAAPVVPAVAVVVQESQPPSVEARTPNDDTAQVHSSSPQQMMLQLQQATQQLVAEQEALEQAAETLEQAKAKFKEQIARCQKHVADINWYPNCGEVEASMQAKVKREHKHTPRVAFDNWQRGFAKVSDIKILKSMEATLDTIESRLSALHTEVKTRNEEEAASGASVVTGNLVRGPNRRGASNQHPKVDTTKARDKPGRRIKGDGKDRVEAKPEAKAENNTSSWKVGPLVTFFGVTGVTLTAAVTEVVCANTDYMKDVCSRLGY